MPLLSSYAVLKRRSKAMKDHEAEQLATRAKTERLRTERLAREAIEPPKKKAKKIVVGQ